MSANSVLPISQAPSTPQDSRATSLSPAISFPGRLRRFLTAPRATKYFTAANLVRRAFSEMPVPWRLPFGAWWLAERGELDYKLLNDGFERTELRFVERLLRPGMTVLDIGAHHGLYTLLSSKCVSRYGTVVAFEASPRESRRLEKHARINRCRNVRVERCAVGSAREWTDFFVVDGACDWGNSLRAPAVAEPTHTVRVEVRTLDDVLPGLGVFKVDFVKLDVEGAELAVLRGARRLLEGPSRPAILAEVQDIRTRPWGYPSREIVQFLAGLNYRWFALAPDSSLHPISTSMDSYDANLVALPGERAREFRMLAERKHIDTRGQGGGRKPFSRDRGIELLKSMVRVRQG